MHSYLLMDALTITGRTQKKLKNSACWYREMVAMEQA